MRKLLGVSVATLLIVSCGPRDAASPDAAKRDLSLATSDAAAQPLVVSAVERQSMNKPASQGKGTTRLVTRARVPAPKPVNEEASAAATELAVSTSDIVIEAPAPVVEAPAAEAGFGHSLAPGQTVSSIPASSMGSGDPPVIQTIARGGAGIMVRRPDDNCAPHGGVVAINRVYPGQGGFRRF